MTTIIFSGGVPIIKRQGYNDYLPPNVVIPPFGTPPPPPVPPYYPHRIVAAPPPIPTAGYSHAPSSPNSTRRSWSVPSISRRRRDRPQPTYTAIGTGQSSDIFKYEEVLGSEVVYGPVAIKRFNLKPGSFESAQCEVSMLTSIPKHPNIVRMFSYKENPSPETPLEITMELCDGDLFHYIRKIEKDGMSLLECEERYWWIVRSLLRALRLLHSMRILHRDIKPDNIMYVIKKQGRRRNGSDDEVEFKLGDFGCARHVGSNGAANTFVGTSPYMAPEVTNHIPYATPADIWGVGCVIYELFNPKHTKYFAEIAEHNYRLHRRYRLASPPLITVWELPPNIITRRNGVEPRWMSLVRAACREEPYARPTASELLEKAHRLFDDYF